VRNECFILGVLKRLDVESQWDGNLERIKAKFVVVVAHVHEEGFLVREMVIILKLIVH
jgi:hypothetical protein